MKVKEPPIEGPNRSSDPKRGRWQGWREDRGPQIGRPADGLKGAYPRVRPSLQRLKKWTLKILGSIRSKELLSWQG